MADELKQKLDMARKNSIQNNVSNKTKQKEEFVLLTRTSSKGYSYPVKQAHGDKNDGRKKKREKVLTHEDGKRVRYFDDDDKYSLKSMVSVIANKNTQIYNHETISIDNFIIYSLKKK